MADLEAHKLWKSKQRQKKNSTHPGSHGTGQRSSDKQQDVQSISRRGNCWNIAPQESFFGHMKEEIIGIVVEFRTFEDMKAQVTDWMDYYNNDRGQWDLLKPAPCE